MAPLASQGPALNHPFHTLFGSGSIARNKEHRVCEYPVGGLKSASVLFVYPYLIGLIGTYSREKNGFMAIPTGIVKGVVRSQISDGQKNAIPKSQGSDMPCNERNSCNFHMEIRAVCIDHGQRGEGARKK